jgi:hypothetical protein
MVTSRRWNARFPIPRPLLARIHTRPSLRIMVKTDPHRCFYAAKELDKSTLSSPQLHVLEITVYYSGAFNDHCTSEFNTLKRLLIRGGNLKTLTLRASPVSRFTPLYLKDGPLNLQFEEHDRFPALEELALGYNEYHLSMEHYQSWLACMDWSQLRKLDLERGMPPHLLSILTGHVTQLKSLRFGVWPDPHNASPTWNSTDFSITERFLQSINGLEHIATWSWDDVVISQLRPTLLDKHGHSLRHLESSLDWRDAWPAGELTRLLEQAPKLRTLSVYIKLHDESYSPCAETCRVR